jgi:hypothetical protein
VRTASYPSARQSSRRSAQSPTGTQRLHPDRLCARGSFASSFCATALAKEQNPVVGYWDPMGLADVPLWNQDEEAVIGALRRRACVVGC